MKKYILALIAIFALSIIFSACEKSEDFENDLKQKTDLATGDGSNGGSQG